MDFFIHKSTKLILWSTLISLKWHILSFNLHDVLAQINWNDKHWWKALHWFNLPKSVHFFLLLRISKWILQKAIMCGKSFSWWIWNFWWKLKPFDFSWKFYVAWLKSFACISTNLSEVWILYIILQWNGFMLVIWCCVTMAIWWNFCFVDKF
jgi:hypothetical protein